MNEQDIMNEQYDNRLLAQMCAKQARMMDTDGMVDDARDLLVSAFAILLSLGTQPKLALIPVRLPRR
jgi:threonine synthase